MLLGPIVFVLGVVVISGTVYLAMEHRRRIRQGRLRAKRNHPAYAARRGQLYIVRDQDRPVA